MRIALDAMGGDHAPGPIVAGAVQAVAADPDLTVVLVGDQAQIEPLLPAGGPPRPASRSSTPPRSSAWTRSRSRPCARSRTTRSAAAGNCWPSRQGGRHRQRRQHRGDGRRRAASRSCSSRASAGPASPPSCRPRKGRASSSTSAPTSTPSRATCSSTASWARSSPGTSSASSSPTIGLMNVGEEEGKGHDLAQETLRPVQRQPAEGPVRRQHRGPRHPPRRGRRGRQRRVRRQRRAQAVRGRLRVRDEDGRPGGARRRCRTSAAEAEQALQGADRRSTTTARSAGPRCWASTASASSATAARGDRAIKNALGVAAQDARARLNEQIVAGTGGHCRRRTSDRRREAS